MAHISAHNFEVEFTGPEGFFGTAFTLIHPRKGGQAKRRLFTESDLAPNTFTSAWLGKISQLMSNPEENARYSLLFFGKYLCRVSEIVLTSCHSPSTPGSMGAFSRLE
jgi:hypothetical protein